MTGVDVLLDLLRRRRHGLPYIADRPCELKSVLLLLGRGFDAVEVEVDDGVNFVVEISVRICLPDLLRSQVQILDTGQLTGKYLQIHLGVGLECDVTGDLASRRGRINGTTTLSGGMAMVSGQVPLSELGDYQSYLKSVTGGAGRYSMHLSHHDPVPGNIQQQLVEAYKPRSEDD